MPYQVANTFSPMTPWGEGIQNITRALFSGPTPMEQESAAAQAEARRLQAEHYRAQNEKLRMETQGLKAAQDRARDPLKAFAQAVFGDTRGQELTDYTRGVQAPTVGVGKTGGMDGDGGDGPLYAPAPMARPGWISPQQLQEINDQARAIAIASALPGKTTGSGYDDVARDIRGARIVQGAQDGTLDTPTVQRVARAILATNGKPLFHDGKFGGMDNSTGQLANPALFNAEIGLTGAKTGAENAQADQRRAAAGASDAHAGLYRAQTADVNDSRALVPVIEPTTGMPKLDADGKQVMVRQADRGRALQRTEGDIAKQDNKDANRDPKTNKFRPPNPSVVQAEIDRVLDVQRDKSGKVDPDRSNQLPLDAATQARVRDRAIEFYKDSGNMAQAVQDALGEVGELKRATEPGRIYGTNELPYRTPANTLPPRAAPNPNARQIAPPVAAPTDIPPPQARVKNQVYQTPKGPMRWTGTGWVLAAPGTDS